MIALLLTPPGAAAIAVVRIVGGQVPAFLSRYFSRPVTTGRAVHGELRDGERLIDDPVVVLIDENSADLSLHGGPWVVRATLELLGRSGFAVQPQTAPLPSEVLDAADALWREVLADLPRAKTERAVRMLLAQPPAWERLLAEPPTKQEVADILADRTMERLLAPPTVAIVGPANAGKSTLANRLFGRERSITADVPGTTRDWVGELANLEGLAVMLVDTPGLRTSDDTIEQSAIERAKTRIGTADVIVLVLDAARPFDDEQRSALRQHADALIVVNKSDLPPAWDVTANVGPGSLPIAARGGQGVGLMSRAVLDRLGCDDLNIDRPRCWTERQRRLLLEMTEDR